MCDETISLGHLLGNRTHPRHAGNHYGGHHNYLIVMKFITLGTKDRAIHIDADAIVWFYRNNCFLFIGTTHGERDFSFRTELDAVNAEIKLIEQLKAQ